MEIGSKLKLAGREPNLPKNKNPSQIPPKKHCKNSLKDKLTFFLFN